MINAVTTAPSVSGDQARQPQQQRARERFEKILNSAEILLTERGIDGFSIPELATRLNMTRASIYNFFPTPNALLNELTKRYLAKLEEPLKRHVSEIIDASWDMAIDLVVSIAARFYNDNPVASILILGGCATSQSYQALQLTIDRISKYGRMLVVAKGLEPPASPPDVFVITTEIVTAIFRTSYYLHDEITEVYRSEAAYAMESYYSRYKKKQD